MNLTRSILRQFEMKFIITLVTFFVFCDLTRLANSNDEKCGRRRGFIGTIYGGTKTQKNDWPWLAALFYKPRDEFFCAGNLISNKHILSGTVV